MASKAAYNDSQRRLYLAMTDRVGEGWLEIFKGSTEFWSSVYWDLFTEIWRAGEPVRKTDALRFMRSVRSAHTAGKYVERALAVGLLEEKANPEDARSKLLDLSPDMRHRLDGFFDRALEELQRTAGQLGPRS